MEKRARFGIVAGAVVIALGLGVYVFGHRRGGSTYVTAEVDRGDIAEVVGATGVLQAVTTVQVGSQVSGTIQSLYADFNTEVKKGQVVARLDPSLFEARVAQSQANLASARSNVERSRANMEDTRQKYDRAKALAAESLLPQTDLDSAKATFEGAVAQNNADKSAVAQAEAALNQSRVDLEHTVIQAPIDGVVLARNVDVGQTVAASLQAPTLFVIANDLTQMEVNASIDEADIGRVRAGQDVTFRVDAFPDVIFSGTLKQVRLQPITNQNVVTYNTIVAVQNPGQRLMPGMTATVSVIVESRKDVLRVPATALRFRPEGFEERGGGRGGGGRSPAGRGAAPDLGAAGASPGAPASGASPGPRRRHEGDAPSGAPAPGRSGLLFVLGDDGRPQPMRVRLGLNDGQHAEILEGLTEGARVVTGLETGGGSRTGMRPASPGANNPFAPQRPQPRAR
jgi:HlyD family secretion protein